MRDGKARDIAAEHANADRVDRPEPAQRRAGAVAFHVVHDGDDKGVEEQRVGKAANAVEQQDQRVVSVAETENQEQHVEHAPQHEADQHGFLRGDDLGDHAGDPRRQGGGETVEGKGEGGLGRGEAQLLDVVREKSQLKAVAGHKHGDGDVSPDQIQRQTEPLFAIHGHNDLVFRVQEDTPVLSPEVFYY